MKRNPIIIGTRGSELARAQTGIVAEQIASITGVQVETVIIKTEGDRVQNLPFHLMDGKGFFTKELEEALLSKRIDVAIHSLKDLPTQSPDGLLVAAIPLRAPANDLLLIRDDVANDNDPLLLPNAPIIGTSAKRRAMQIKAAHSGTTIKELRGNVPTRIRKLMDGEYDAILVAEAGFQRLGLSPLGYRRVRLDFGIMAPAPGQGALAVQIRENDEWLKTSLSVLHDSATSDAVTTERAALELLGGGCGMPFGVYAERENGLLKIRGVLGPEDWNPSDEPKFVRGEAEGMDCDEAARLLIDALGFSDAK
jgi:hydroxymethylbilane synthase